MQRVVIGCDDAPTVHRVRKPVEVHQLVTRAEHGDTRTTMHIDDRGAHGCQHTGLRRPDRCPGREDRLTLAQVFASRADIVVGVTGICDRDALDATVAVLDTHDRVRPPWHRRARHDAGRSAGSHVDRREPTGGYRLQHLQHDRRLGGCPGHIVGANGVAVHGRIVPRRERDRRHDRGGEDLAERVEQRDALNRTGLDVRYDPVDCFCDGQHQRSGSPVDPRTRPVVAIMSGRATSMRCVPRSRPAPAPPGARAPSSCCRGS